MASRQWIVTLAAAITSGVSGLGFATQVTESGSNAQCVLRLLVPPYPYADRVSNASAALRAVVKLDADGAVQSQQIDIISGPKDQRFFKAAIERGLQASTFSKTCDGQTVRLTFRFKMGAADEVWFQYPDTYEITALAPLITTSGRRKPPLAVPLSRSQDDPTQPKGSLASLTWKTGWIDLGETTADLKKWAVGLDRNTEFATGVYEIVGSNWNRREPRLPKVGARIRLVTSVPVEILDYATAGEKRRLEAPSSASRPLGRDDQTGIRLAAGTILEVRAVKVSRPYGHIRVIWARVVPVSQ